MPASLHSTRLQIRCMSQHVCPMIPSGAGMLTSAGPNASDWKPRNGGADDGLVGQSSTAPRSGEDWGKRGIVSAVNACRLSIETSSRTFLLELLVVREDIHRQRALSANAA